MAMASTENRPAVVAPMRYVAFCDVLGFANAVQERFEETIETYDQFARMVGEWPFPEKVEICVYSDSILILSDELAPLLNAVQSLSFATLAHDFLIRGGIAYGRYWERRENGNLFIVSDALVRAVKLESSIKIPGVGFSPEVEIPLSAWMPHFSDEIFLSPVLHFRDTTIVNPFNKFWFASARNRVAQMLDRFPEHSKKYEWFLELATAVERRDLMVAGPVIDLLLTEGVIKRRTAEDADLTESDGPESA